MSGDVELELLYVPSGAYIAVPDFLIGVCEGMLGVLAGRLGESPEAWRGARLAAEMLAFPASEWIQRELGELGELADEAELEERDLIVVALTSMIHQAPAP